MGGTFFLLFFSLILPVLTVLFVVWVVGSINKMKKQIAELEQRLHDVTKT